ncbi:MAG TPA: hypothetical protein VGC62_06680, partial [Pseudomonas sp.]|uniref:hypothetical protein n=1 Tax=Pseudomonas sp. TaxID=306 RepID=UPI002EDAB8EE
IFAFNFLTPDQIAAVKAGTAGDYRAIMQNMINVASAAGMTLVMNAAQWRMAPLPDASPNFGLCLDIPSNTTIRWELGGTLQLLAHNNTIYQMLRVWDRTDVRLINPPLDGRKDLNSASTGEFGMGIDIRGGNRIRVEYPVTNNTWGDGIYFGRGATTGVPQGCYILRPDADACRRQGMSITTGKNITVESARWTNIGGTSPGAGLDIEPDNNTEELIGIRILNPYTENCAGPGILIALQAFAGVIPKTVDITIENHTDDGSVVGYSAGGVNTTTNGLIATQGTYVVKGKITTLDPCWKNSKGAAFLSSEHDVLGPQIQAVRPTVVDCNRSASAAPSYGSPFVVLRDTGSPRTYVIGNAQVLEPTVVINSGSIPKTFFYRDNVAASGNVARADFVNPRSIVGVTVNNNGGHYGTGRLSDEYAQLGNDTASTQGNYGNYGALVAANASVSFDLSDTLYLAGGPDIIIRQPYAASCIVRTGGAGNGTGRFRGLGIGQRLQANGKPGAYLRVRPEGANVFKIIENVGPWSVLSVSGTTANRPVLTASDVGVGYLDTTLAAAGKPITWNGASWVDATGAVV